MARVKYFQPLASKRGERPSTIASSPFNRLSIFLGMLNIFLIQLPICAVLYILSSKRLHPTWSWPQSLLITFVRRRGDVHCPRGSFPHIDFAGDQQATFKPNETGTPLWIPKLEAPLAGELGEMMAKTGDELARNSAWWYGKDHDKPHDGTGKVCLYLHGGGYCFASATLTSPTIKPLLSMLTANAESGARGDEVPLKGLALEYRLSHLASLPGIISDAVAAWRYLIQDCGYSPSDIVISGDSAGAHLTLALTRYLVTEKPYGGGLPKGIVIYSPWVDLSLSYVWAGSGDRYDRYDYLSTKIIEVAAGEALRGVDPQDARDSLYIASVTLARPLTGKEFEGFPPALMHGGDHEILHEEDVALAKHYSDAGSPIEVYFDKNMCHDVYVMPLAFDEEGKAAALRTTAWFQRLWA